MKILYKLFHRITSKHNWLTTIIRIACNHSKLKSHLNMCKDNFCNLIMSEAHHKTLKFTHISLVIYENTECLLEKNTHMRQ